MDGWMGAHRVSISTSRRDRGLSVQQASERTSERAGTVGNNSIQFNSIFNLKMCSAATK